MTKRTKLLPKKEEEQHEHGSKFCNKIFDIGVNFIEEWDRSGFSIGMVGSKSPLMSSIRINLQVASVN